MDEKEAISIIMDIANNGSAPDHGCKFFDYGNKQYYDRLVKFHIKNGFKEYHRSDSRFIIGQYGCGKTHFAQAFSEIGVSEYNCASSFISLGKQISIKDGQQFCGSVIESLSVPGIKGKGLKKILEGYLNKIKKDYPDWHENPEPLKAEISSLDDFDFEHQTFGWVIKKTILALLEGNDNIYQNGIFWLSGNIGDSRTCKELNIPKSTSNMDQYYKLILSIFQFISNKASYSGTIIVVDEGDGLRDDNKKNKFSEICYLFNNLILSLNKVKLASVLFIFIITPDILSEMNKCPMLEQKIKDANDKDFWNGNDHTTKIDMDQRPLDENKTNLSELIGIGNSILQFAFREFGHKIFVDKIVAEEFVIKKTEDILKRNPSRNNVRDISRDVASFVLDNSSVFDEDDDKPEPEI
ncbi:BREX system ATP-binding domain-containing protein [Methanospirillum sp.]|uniref:BREX system ATP-binding domain-containing protein n=1 Tax=Methanospirillum sp. TaxID=45200 RepID=UPI0035A04378